MNIGCVSIAAKALDKRVPEWQNKIDLRELDILMCGRCILGQIYGNFIKAPWDLSELEAFGGNLNMRQNIEAMQYEKQWRIEIESRLNRSKAS